MSAGLLTPIDRVLVVDDDESARTALAKSLRRLGYEVDSAEDGEEGLRLAVELRPRVILSDIRMPRMDGHTLLRRLRAQGVDAAVIVMSGQGSVDDVIDVLRAGAVDYLKKPWSSSELIAAVGRAVDVHETRRVGGSADEGKPDARTTRPAAVVAAPAVANPKEASGSGTILQQLERGEITLPPIPAVLAELGGLLSQPDAALREITSLVERDSRLAAEVLRVTNSSHYARGARINDIGGAINRIGVRQLQSLVQTVITRNTHQATVPMLRALQTRIWRYSIARAVAMRGLAELAGTGGNWEPETAYVAGLMADAGASFLLWVASERVSNGTRALATEESYIRALVDQHQEVGEAILTRWSMDPVSILIARSHHHDAPPAPPSQYWNLAILGEAMADEICPGGGDPTRLEGPSSKLVDRCGAELRIGTSTAARIRESVRREFEGMMEALG